MKGKGKNNDNGEMRGLSAAAAKTPQRSRWRLIGWLRENSQRQEQG
jgi:hypothetical protein